MQLPLGKTRLGILAGVLGAAGALTLVAAGGSDSDPASTFRNASSSDEAPGDISGPCDEAEHADDPECAGVTVTDPGTTPTTPTTAGPADGAAPGSTGGSHALPTAGGTVTYRSNGSSLTLVSAMPASGWRVEVEQSSGREIELDFRSGSRRVQVNLEIEDGRVRERVRVRDDATGIDVRVEDGAVVRDDSDDGDRHGGADGSDDNSGPGSSSSGSGSSGSDSSGSDDSGSDDSGSGGHGSDD